MPTLHIFSITSILRVMNLMSSLKPGVLLIIIKYALRSLYFALRFDTLELLFKFTRLLLLLGASLVANVTDRLSCSDCRTVFIVEISALGHRTSILVILEDHFISLPFGRAAKIDIRGRLVLRPRFFLFTFEVDRIRVERTIGNFLFFLHCRYCS